jgi:hypothetical protein
MRGAAHIALYGERISVYSIIMGKLEAERPLGRRRRRWNGNIKKDLQNRGKWLALAIVVMNLRVP